MKVAFRTANGKYLTIPQGDADQLGPAQIVEAVLIAEPMPPPPGPGAGWWGPDRASLYAWVDAHYLNRATATPATINYWVDEILQHPGDDPNPQDNEGYWIRQMSK